MIDRSIGGASDGEARAGIGTGWLLFLLAAALRLPALGLRPLHHDEGSNVIFILRLVREGVYQYDPANYHGPLLFYASALPFLLFGARTWALRVIPALLGSGLAPLSWSLRRFTGRSAAAAAGLLLAASPALVYYARDAIHETYLVFLTLALVAAGWRALESTRPAAAALAGIAAGGIVATKETSIIVFAGLAVGAAVAWWIARPGGAALQLETLLPRAALAFGLALGVAAAFYTRAFRAGKLEAAPTAPADSCAINPASLAPYLVSHASTCEIGRTCGGKVTPAVFDFETSVRKGTAGPQAEVEVVSDK